MHSFTISDTIYNRKNRQLYLSPCLTFTIGISFGGHI